MKLLRFTVACSPSLPTARPEPLVQYAFPSQPQYCCDKILPKSSPPVRYHTEVYNQQLCSMDKILSPGLKQPPAFCGALKLVLFVGRAKGAGSPNFYCF